MVIYYGYFVKKKKKDIKKWCSNYFTVICSCKDSTPRLCTDETKKMHRKIAGDPMVVEYAIPRDLVCVHPRWNYKILCLSPKNVTNLTILSLGQSRTVITDHKYQLFTYVRTLKNDNNFLISYQFFAIFLSSSLTHFENLTSNPMHF